MAPVISPNKTWAGLVGGLLSSGGVFTLLVYLFPYFSDLFGIWSFIPFKSLPGAFLIGVILALSGQAGDLFISYFKRKVSIKDTGNIIPGHGGGT